MMKKNMHTLTILVIALVAVVVGASVLLSCKSKKKEERKAIVESQVVHPEWSKNAVIYEVNVRQFTPEGTFDAFAGHLPRLKEMGVDLLWLMPIHPIGEKNRKGSLGSYYSIKDYKGVNPEFGDMDDFKALVNKAHELGMYVILDWVANHTAWDHAWMEEHPEWYSRDLDGTIVSPFDWTDVADLDYTNEALHDAMIDAMKFWVEEADVDGFRCDVAGMVPVHFWNRARKELDEVKPVFMLAEAEQPNHHVHAFDMSYGWELHHIMNGIAKGEKTTKDIDRYFKKHDTLYPVDAYRMYFITNHDENSWNGTEYERMGGAVDVFAVLTFTLPGMPMLYSGQEAGLDKRLRFFEKDTIDWSEIPHEDFYRKLIALRKDYSSLWSGSEGGSMRKLKTSEKEGIYAFMRKGEDNAVVVLANLSPYYREFNINMKGDGKAMTDYFTGEAFSLDSKQLVSLPAWQYKVLVTERE